VWVWKIAWNAFRGSPPASWLSPTLSTPKNCSEEHFSEKRPRHRKSGPRIGFLSISIAIPNQLIPLNTNHFGFGTLRISRRASRMGDPAAIQRS
jgi:hypothetical protein